MKALLTGASGFIGGQLLTALEAAGHAVTPVLRRPDPALPSAEIADLRHDDLPALSGYDVVMHAASVTSGSVDALWEGNVLTTRRLAALAGRSDTAVVYVSTTGVYGRSSGTFDDPYSILRRPASALSATRAAAEDVVLASGGTVVRPHVVHGVGDRWVVPHLAQFMLAEDAWLGGVDVAVAAISARRLAAGIAAFIERDPLPSIVHAAEHHPVPVSGLVLPYFQAAGRSLPTAVLTVEEAFEKLRSRGVTRSALAMLGVSSSMNSAEFWGPARTKRQMLAEPLCR